MKNEDKVKVVLEQFKNKIINSEFVTDKSGVKTVEILGASITLDPRQKYLEFNGRKSSKKYIEAELKWYDSQNLDIEEISKSASLWKQVCNKDNKVNSNYGYLIYSKENGNQYQEVLKKLEKNPYSRQALMVYTRPSIHKDASENGMNDFICTLGHQFFIRNDKLYSVVMMRSCDIIYGFMNDFAWFATVQERLYNDLIKTYPNLDMGDLVHISSSLHLYEKHFELVKTMCE